MFSGGLDNPEANLPHSICSVNKWSTSCLNAGVSNANVRLNGDRKMKDGHMKKGRSAIRGTVSTAFALLLAATLGGCMGSNELAGTTFGGIAGGAIGNQFGKGDGKVAATALGAVIGASVGGALGRSLDEQSRIMAEQATHQALRSSTPGTYAYRLSYGASLPNR